MSNLVTIKVKKVLNNFLFKEVSGLTKNADDYQRWLNFVVCAKEGNIVGKSYTGRLGEFVILEKDKNYSGYDLKRRIDLIVKLISHLKKTVNIIVE